MVGTWLLVVGCVLLLGSAAGLIRLQFLIPDRRLTLITSILMMIAGLLFIVTAIWIAGSEQLPYSVEGIGVSAPDFHYRRR